jgi:branched-chain amino acid aminotransferase
MGKFLININGELFDENTAKVSVFDRGFLYGDSVYEATRTFSRRAFRIERHLERLFKSAERIELTPTFTKEDILKQIDLLIKASGPEDLALRIVLTRGVNSDLGLDPGLSGNNNLIIFSKPIAPNPESWTKVGVSLIFFQKKIPAAGALPKTGNYQENMLGYKLSQEKHCFDALMVNTEGHVSEGTTSNAWLIKDGTLFTPPLRDGVLDGLTRQSLFEMDRLGLLPCSLKERSLTPEDFLGADECFISSTTRNLVPVTSIEGKPIGTGKPGKLTLDTLLAYKSYVGLH